MVGKCRLTVFNPATGDLVSDQVPVAGESDVNRAVDAANAAFAVDGAWRTMTNVDRRNLLLRFADLLERDQEELAYLTRVTLGAPFSAFGKGEIGTAIENFRCKFTCGFSVCPAEYGELILIYHELDYAGWIDKFAGESFPADDGFYKIVRYEPLGVVAGCVAFRIPRIRSGSSADGTKNYPLEWSTCLDRTESSSRARDWKRIHFETEREGASNGGRAGETHS